MSELSGRLSRLLFLVPHVAKSPDGVELDQLAEELGIEQEELLADLDLLTQVGPPTGDPGEYLLVTFEKGRVYVDLAQRLTRPLRLTPAEGCSLLLGIRSLKRSGIAPYDDALRSAEKKLLAALGTEAKVAEQLAEGTVVVGEGQAVSRHLRALLEAARERRSVEIEYAAASSGQAMRRGLEPYGIVHHGGAWYVIGRCQKRGDTRTFRVDRIVALASTGQAFMVPPDFDLEAYRRERMYVPSADAVVVRARFDRIGAARVGAAWPAGEVVTLEGGGAEIAIECEGIEWVLGWVLSFGRHAEIVAPEEARTALCERLATMRDAHAGYKD
ncbi:MAG: WYL domain-containing protein [Deltaproteobacteria bacterium]|nr:WYL domain-containing protein [Deltaproteobacteria bacterium]